MAIKPIESNAIPEIPYGKVLFLIIILFIAIFAFSLQKSHNPVGAEKKTKETKEDITPSIQEEKYHIGKDEESPDIKKDINYQDELVKEVQKTYDSVAKGAQDKTKDVADDILGVAQKKVEKTASDSADTITNTIYKSTVGQIILQLIDSMPEEAWEEMKPQVCSPKNEGD